MAILVDQASIGAASPGDGTSAAFTTNQIVAANGFIVVCLGFFTQLTVNSVSGGGLSWTIDAQGWPAGGPAADVVCIASAQAPAGLASGTTITASTSGTMSGPTIGGMSFTGVKTSSPVDGTPPAVVGVTPAAAGWATGSYAMTAGSVLVGTSWAETSSATSTPTSPSIESYDSPAGTSGWGATAAYRIEASSGSYTVAGTWGSNQQSATVGVAYLMDTGTPVSNTLISPNYSRHPKPILRSPFRRY